MNKKMIQNNSKNTPKIYAMLLNKNFKKHIKPQNYAFVDAIYRYKI